MAIAVQKKGRMDILQINYNFIRKKMSIFLYPNNLLMYCYFFIPSNHLPQLQKSLYPQMDSVNSPVTETLNIIVEKGQNITLTKEDLEMKSYEQNKKPWTEKQDKLLLSLCQDENARFQQIAMLIPNRNAKMCYSRYRRLTNQVKQAWTEEENNRLRKLTNQHGQDWKLIATFFKKRNDKQLKDHYLNYLRPNLNKGEWSLEEDLRLIELINTYGKNWKLIEDKMTDRSRNQIKNRYFGRIKKLDDQKKKRQPTSL